MTREEIIKIINDDPHLTTEQGKAIIERMEDCEYHIIDKFNSLVKKHSNFNAIVNEMLQVCFMVGYVYASLELNGEVKV